jgi:glycosyltransferase involved in cell wall biosynthesis
LARWQAQLGIQAAVAAPAQQTRRYTVDGLPVYRFQTGAPNLRDLYGEGDASAAEAFSHILDVAAPDVVHLHAYTSAVSLRLLRATHNKGLPVVFTYHTPTVTCARGTLLRYGREICDGGLETQKCAACVLEGHQTPAVLSRALGRLPVLVGRALGNAGLAGGAWTALRMTELIELRHKAVLNFLAETDRIVAVCEWVRELLIRNGIEESKIMLSRQGLADSGSPAATTSADVSGPLRVAFLGRMSRVKGLPILVDAVLAAAPLPVHLDVFGVVQDEEGRRLRDELIRQISGKGCVRLLAPLQPGSVVSTLKSYDVLAVPSQWLESGPLVVYEAFAAGVPVLGSRLGGLKELVEHEVNGLLVEASSTGAWTAALRRLVSEPGLLERLRAGIGPVRTMREAAEEMIQLYSTLPLRQIAMEGRTA